MPIYSFYCSQCDWSFEENVSVKERDSYPCPKCHAKVKREISAGTYIPKRDNPCGGCSEMGGCPGGMCGM